MRVLVTGSNGQLGSEIRQLSLDQHNFTFFFTDVKELDITDRDAVNYFITKNGIKFIINCAAYTAVDKAETEKELADKINHLSVANLAEAAKENHAKMIHISTDYVFSGENFKPYEPYEATAPVNEYGASKLAGEKVMQEIEPNSSIIIRTSWVYSSYGVNFVKTMIRLGKERSELNVIADQVGAPTYARDLAEFILTKAINASHSGVKLYHFTNEGVCSWYDFAIEIMRLRGMNCEITPISTSAYPTPAKRPFYSVMDKASVKKDFNVKIRHWRNGLEDCMTLLKKKD